MDHFMAGGIVQECRQYISHLMQENYPKTNSKRDHLAWEISVHEYDKNVLFQLTTTVCKYHHDMYADPNSTTLI